MSGSTSEPPPEAASGPGPGETAQAALLRVYFERRDSLVRIFAARTGSAAEAEDLVQDLYLKISAAKLDQSPQNIPALLFRIAHNLMLDRARGERRSATRDTVWRAVSHENMAGEDVAHEPPPDEAAGARLRLERLVAAAAELPPQMGRAFRLHKLQGLTHAETAQAMGLSVKAVEKHVSAALKALTRKLAP